MSLFVDTSALYALLVASEPNHATVRSAFQAAAEKGRRMVTTSYVLVETMALLQHRIGLAAARDLDRKILPLLEVIWIDEPTHRRAVARLLRIDRRQVSLVDAVSFETMDAEGIRDALALDADFAEQGYRLIGG